MERQNRGNREEEGDSVGSEREYGKRRWELGDGLQRMYISINGTLSPYIPPYFV